MTEEGVLLASLPVAGLVGQCRPEWLHAAMSRILDSDHHASSKPWSAWIGPVVDGLPTITVAALNDRSAELLMGVPVGQQLRLGPATGIVPAPPVPLEWRTWANLTAEPPSSTWDVEMLTPTVFGRRDRFSPWPDPASLVRSLSVRWEAFSTEKLPRLGHEDLRAIWVMDLEGHSEHRRLVLGSRPGADRRTGEGPHTSGSGRARHELALSGFVGFIRYRCDCEGPSRVFSTLLGLAELVGAGRYTTHGFGQVRVAATSARGIGAGAAVGDGES